MKKFVLVMMLALLGCGGTSKQVPPQTEKSPTLIRCKIRWSADSQMISRVGDSDMFIPLSSIKTFDSSSGKVYATAYSGDTYILDAQEWARIQH